ncbi:alpha/beta fold hydrolase [Paraferrimonas sedimenticola]|uniref:AB hydrolase-1 domain-containing protein n=1 Tax=Paraferrimonas sedimenticola TaxID=375674 RepID=A0AA37W0X2_9GAMM|nr:alpha/beta hydrolase [Paraferrimonas sedimenticola]GLP96193.1 hypothetical protein GCM10007895_14990 [Paraferrimonas sedimenticola]
MKTTSQTIDTNSMATAEPSVQVNQDVMYLYKSQEGFEAIKTWYDELVDQIEIDFTSEYVDTRFGKTHMLVCGPEDGEPMILVQAVAGSAPLWRNQLPVLAKRFRVYALDTVGQPGRSAPNPPSYFNNDYLNWLCDVQDSLGLKKSHFIGVSTGGWKVMRMATDYPERVDKVVMLSPMGLSHARLPWKIWFKRVMQKSKDANALENELTAKSIKSPSASGSVSFGSFDRQLARAMALCTRHFRLDRAMCIYNDKTQKISFIKAFKLVWQFFTSEKKSLLQKMEAPGLVLFGEHEILYNPDKVSKKALKLMPNVEVGIIEKSGHACIYDQPAESNRRIMRFFDGIKTQTAPEPLADTNVIKERLIKAGQLEEIHGEDGGPYMRLMLKRVPNVEAGFMRIWKAPQGSHIDRVFHIWMGGRGNDMNLMYAMTRADSPVPHFLMHYNLNPKDIWSYHIDMVPKVDGVMYPDYWRKVMSPLSAITESKAVKAIPTRRIQADRKQYLSSWSMYGKEVPKEEYMYVRDEVMPHFVDHFLELVDNCDYRTVGSAYLIERGRKQMDVLFDREMDRKGWGRLEALFGEEAGEALRKACRDELCEIEMPAANHY